MSLFLQPEMTPELEAIRHDTATQLNAIYISVTVVTAVVVGLRLWARRVSSLHYGWDDIFMIVATVFMCGNLAIGLLAVKNGLGIIPFNLTLENLVTIRKLVFSQEILYVINIALIKFSILIMYCRIFALRSFRIAAWTLGVVTILWLGIYVFIYIFQCSPINEAWNPLELRLQCLNLRSIFISNAIVNIVTDFAILLMPLYHVWSLQMRLAQRIVLSLVFMLGCFVITSSIYRFITILRLDTITNSYDLKEPMVWSHIEICTGIVCGCLPWLRPLLTGLFIKLGLTTSDSSNSHSHSASNVHSQNTTISSKNASSSSSSSCSKHHPHHYKQHSGDSSMVELGSSSGDTNRSNSSTSDDRYSERRKNSQSDALTLHSIIITTLEQSVNQYDRPVV